MQKQLFKKIITIFMSLALALPLFAQQTEAELKAELDALKKSYTEIFKQETIDDTAVTAKIDAILEKEQQLAEMKIQQEMVLAGQKTNLQKTFEQEKVDLQINQDSIREQLSGDSKSLTKSQTAERSALRSARDKDLKILQAKLNGGTLDLDKDGVDDFSFAEGTISKEEYDAAVAARKTQYYGDYASLRKTQIQSKSDLQLAQKQTRAGLSLEKKRLSLEQNARMKSLTH